MHDPIVAPVPRPTTAPFRRTSPLIQSGRFMGFSSRIPRGAIVGQFPHVFPASIAIGYGLDGLTGARRAVGVWVVLGLLARLLSPARLVGRAAAVAAAGLLALNVAQVWFARYPNAEVVMQALLFAALLAHARAHVDDDGVLRAGRGPLLGLLLFLRIDAVVASRPSVASLALGVLADRARARVSFFVAFGVTAALAGAYLVGPMRHYADLPIVFLSHFAWWQYTLLAAGAAAGIGALALGTRLPALGNRVRTLAPTLLAFAVVGAAVYALLLREPIHGLLAPRDAYSLRNVHQLLPHGSRAAGGAARVRPARAARLLARAPKSLPPWRSSRSSSSTRFASPPITSRWRDGSSLSSCPARCSLPRPRP